LKVDALVNATSVGMTPNVEATPVTKAFLKNFPAVCFEPILQAISKWLIMPHDGIYNEPLQNAHIRPCMSHFFICRT
jgi:hypothetical protein